MENEDGSGDAAGVGGDPGPEVGALLGNRSSDGRPLHLTLKKWEQVISAPPTKPKFRTGQFWERSILSTFRVTRRVCEKIAQNVAAHI
jgi:hypothetical protein